MKKKVFTIVSVVVVAVLYYFSISGLKGAENKQTTVTTAAKDSIFTNCIFNSSFSEVVSWGKSGLHIAKNTDRYNELNFNAIHTYDSGDSLYGLQTGLLFGDQIPNYQHLLDSIDQKKLHGFYERSFIGKYAYGQRLIYEVAPNNGNQSLNYGFVYQTRERGNYEMDSGRTVVHAIPTPATYPAAGYLCRDIYENLQHSDLFDFRQNDKGLWHIKPVMRIPQEDTNLSKRVVRIDVIRFDGVIVDSIIITAGNFRNNGVYNGEYLEKYFDVQPELKISGDTNSMDLNHGHHERYWKWDDSCKVDFRVFWYGECEVWFDKMIVDDEIADYLFNTDNQPLINDRIQQEVVNFTNYKSLYSFFIDEICISQYPCIKYIVDTMRHYRPDAKLSLAVTNYLHIHGLKNDNLSYQIYLDSIQPNFLQADHHGFYTDKNNNGIKIPNVLAGHNDSIPDDWFTTPADYNNVLQNYIFGSETETAVKNSAGSLIFEIKKTRESINTYSPNTKFIMQPQIHGFIYPDTNNGIYDNGLREPTNEEIQAQAMLSIAHGANSLCWFIYNSHRWISDYGNIKGSMLGLLDPVTDTAKRISNDYGQNKWAYVSAMNGKILNWLPVLENTNWQNGFSVHSQTASHNYISNIKSFYETNNGLSSECVEDNLMGDCEYDTFWEEGFFAPKNTSDNSKYFMMVNRRCIPKVAGGYPGDLRLLKILFSSSQLLISNNWKLINVENDSLLVTFNKNSNAYIDLGYFQPGEGRLYKLVPVKQEGGTLVADETISGNTTCNGMIYSNGHNITISPNTTITFSDSAGIEMNGGCFVSNLNADNVEPVTLTGKTSTTFWKGITLNGCDSIGVYNTNISNIKANDTAKAFSIINSYKVHFRRNTINANSNSGGIQAVYNNFSDTPPIFNVRDCNFNMNQSGYSAISIFSNASATLPIVVEWCLFNSSNDTSNAIMFTEVTGGAIKNNIFTNFGKSVVLMYSTTDLYGNTILGKNNSQGIQCLSGSNVSLSPNSGQYLGGYNYIKNYGSSSSNICSDNSNFNINNGQNDFDIDDLDNSKHLTGTFSGQQQLSVNAKKNCFHKDSTTNIDATHTVIWNSSSDPVNFVFTDYSCELSPPEDYFVYQYGGYNDTVYYSSGGEGGGFNPNKPMNIEENVYKSLKDTININLRKRNYLTVEDKAKQLLTLFPDSLESIGAVQKLYMASLSLDSTKIGVTKAFLENLIATNTQNSTLIKRAFYFIQKCKVKLKQYQSALDGFQYIMTQNPYTYEGLVASWDYAATYLLMGSGGSYTGDFEQTTEELNTPADTLLNRMTKRDINTNKNTSTNENEQTTKTFYEKIKNVTKDDKAAQEEKVKTLEKKIQTTKNKTEKNDAVTELATMKQIKEVVKLKKPNTIVTHTAIINSDIKKVFGIGKGNKDEPKNNLIPTTYTLYQNYPNPFNPITKIAFDLPNDAKVKLVIYDILGREMKTLVNNEFRSAGKYITEFNGSNLSSGIYFARILVNEGKDFIAVKKMVLVK